MGDAQLVEGLRAELAQVSIGEHERNLSTELGLCEVEHVLNHPRHSSGAGDEHPARFCELLGIERTPCSEVLGEHRDGVEWVAKVVAQDADEAAARFARDWVTCVFSCCLQLRSFSTKMIEASKQQAMLGMMIGSSPLMKP